MGAETAISWTDHTFNPWWGCSRVSPGCEHCYAETFAKRTGHDVWGKVGPRRVIGDNTWRQPLVWARDAANAGRVDKVFCASMADVFELHDGPMVDSHGELAVGRSVAGERERLWHLIAECGPSLVWQLLTKRPENVLPNVPVEWLCTWPSNVWVGTTVEDQKRADERLPHLLLIPAAVRFLSCEPLLGPVDLRPWLRRINDEARAASTFSWDTSRRVDWVIAGGESGPGHRPLDLDNARQIRDECQVWGVPFLFKQVGGQFPTSGGCELDGREWHEFPALSIPEGRST